MGPPSAPPVAVPKPLPVPPALDLQGLRKDLSELVRAAKDTDAREKATAAEVAQISVELGVAIAERLLGAEIAANRQRLDQIVVGVLEKMPAARSVSVRGHPGDVALLQIQLTGHVDWPSHRDLLKFRADETCERGRFKVESPDWFVEWDTQRALKELRTALLEETFAEER
jgi:flagellar biosynthesis/type III secretory pathway protein FliH